MPSSISRLKFLLLRAPALKLAVAESMTGGLVQARVTAIPGASGFFPGGLTAYTLEQKVNLLGVERAAAGRVNSVSAAVAAQMARGAVRLFGADVAVATTGYAEPAPEAGVDEPFAYWAIGWNPAVTGQAGITGKVVCPGMNRTQAQACVADAVIAELIACLESRK